MKNVPASRRDVAEPSINLRQLELDAGIDDLRVDRVELAIGSEMSALAHLTAILERAFNGDTRVRAERPGAETTSTRHRESPIEGAAEEKHLPAEEKLGRRRGPVIRRVALDIGVAVDRPGVLSRGRWRRRGWRCATGEGRDDGETLQMPSKRGSEVRRKPHGPAQPENSRHDRPMRCIVAHRQAAAPPLCSRYSSKAFLG